MVIEHGEEVTDAHGAMAGLPVAPSFANWYLKDVDALFYKRGISYFRYSDEQMKAWGYRSLVHEFYKEKHSISPEY